MSMLMLIALLAQSPGSGAQFKVTLELHGYRGALTEVGGRCPVGSTLDNAEVAEQYKSHDAISFETSDEPMKVEAMP
jgi:hypothetical protein